VLQRVRANRTAILSRARGDSGSAENLRDGVQEALGEILQDELNRAKRRRLSNLSEDSAGEGGGSGGSGGGDGGGGGVVGAAWTPARNYAAVGGSGDGGVGGTDGRGRRDGSLPEHSPVVLAPDSRGVAQGGAGGGGEFAATVASPGLGGGVAGGVEAPGGREAPPQFDNNDEMWDDVFGGRGWLRRGPGGSGGGGSGGGGGVGGSGRGGFGGHSGSGGGGGGGGGGSGLGGGSGWGGGVGGGSSGGGGAGNGWGSSGGRVVTWGEAAETGALSSDEFQERLCAHILIFPTHPCIVNPRILNNFRLICVGM